MAGNDYLTTDSRRTVTRRAALFANEAWQDWLQAGVPPESMLGKRLARLQPMERQVYISGNAPFKPDWRGENPGLALSISAMDAPVIDEAVRKQMERIVAESMMRAMLHHKKVFLGAMLRDQVHNDPPYYHFQGESRLARAKHSVSRAMTTLRIRNGH